MLARALPVLALLASAGADAAPRRLGGPQFLQPDRLTALAVSPDGKLVATGSAKQLRVWDATTGAAVYAPPDLTSLDRVDAIAFVGDSLVYARGDEPIAVASTKDWSEREIAPCGKRWTIALAPSPDGKRLAVICENLPAVLVTPLDGGAPPTAIKAGKRLDKVAWSADGAWLAVLSVDDDKLKLVNLATNKVTALRYKQRPHAIAFAPKGAVVAFDDHYDFTTEAVVLYDAAAGKEVGRYRTAVGATSIAFSADGTTLAFGQMTGARALVAIDLASGARRELLHPTVIATALAFADPAGKRVWVGHDSAARLWDLATDAEVRGPAGHRGPVTALAYSPDGKTLASGSGDRTIRLWDVARGSSRVLEVLTDEYGVVFIQTDDDYKKMALGEVKGLGWSKDGTRLYAADAGNFRSWDVARGVQLHAKGLQPIGIKHFALAPDGTRAYALGLEDGLAGTVRIVGADDGRAIRKLDRVSDEGLALSPDGKRLAVPTGDGVSIRDAATGTAIRTIAADRVRALAFSPDGKRLATGPAICDVATGKLIEEVSSAGDVDAVAFAPDGRLIAGTYHGDVVIGQQVVSEAHHGDITAIAVAPDGKSVATGGQDGQILIWPL